MFRKEMIAMILAGGQGSRLGIFTKTLAKPAVPFGGKYRIIDFVLSNCSNSGIDTVGVLTQYRPLILNAHIGIGSPWDLDRKTGGVSILAPYMREKEGSWYRGTAHAIYQNIHFIEQYDPQYVLILSGDHIYKMNYNKMLDYHKARNSKATIAVLEVSHEEAKRFGIMNTTSDDRIYEFEEKPKQPKSNLASMGVYIFDWKVLKEYLVDGEKDRSADDFGKNIIPKMLEDSVDMFAYRFKGYWKDVGTVESLWEANMDLIDPENPLDLHDKHWRIYSVNPGMPPHYVGSEAKVDYSLITEGCSIYGKVNQSVLFFGAEVHKGAEVSDSVIMSNVIVEEGAVIEKAIIGDGAVIRKNMHLKDENGGIFLVEQDAVVDESYLAKKREGTKAETEIKTGRAAEKKAAAKKGSEADA
ncbi:MAG: glucose-1-phosphate adenylyltransferase [Peptostreptococcaceae bacterium]|nr:glucose-1-phosphate adenylyltransferase [Peptostreptococcaceae bacterium]